MKMPKHGAVAGCAFREYRNPISQGQRIADVLVYPGGIAALCALDEQCPCIPAQPAE